MPVPDKFSRKITFTARYVVPCCQHAQFMYHLCFHSGDIGSRSLVLLLAFDFAKSNVFPLPHRQEQRTVVWKYDLVIFHCIFPDSTLARIVKFQNPGTLTHDVTYTNRYVVRLYRFLRSGSSTFFIGSHLPRPRGYRRR